MRCCCLAGRFRRRKANCALGGKLVGDWGLGERESGAGDQDMSYKALGQL